MKAKNNQPEINLKKCPFCSKIAYLIRDSGIANFKKGGTCAMGECQECGHRSIIG